MQRLDYNLRKEIEISNVVCTSDLGQPIEINNFDNFKFLSSNSKRYSCGYVKDDTMTGKVSVFRSGKLISVGTKNPQQAYRELVKASEILKKNHLIKSYKIIPKVRNIVSKTSLGKPVNIIHLAQKLPHCLYEPEQFPGIIYRMTNNVVALIFASGKIVITGAKKIEELNTAYFELLNDIKK